MNAQTKIITFEISPVFTIVKPTDCPHVHLEISKQNRTLTCSHCKQDVDAFDFLYEDAANEQGLFWRMEEIKHHIQVLTQERDTLHRQVVNLKAQKKYRIKSLLR